MIASQSLICLHDGVRNIGDRKRRCACFRELVGDADRGFGAHPTRLNHQAWGLVFSGSAQFRDAYLDTDYIVHSNGGMVVIRMTRSGHATPRLPLDRASYVNCGARGKCRRIGCELYCSIPNRQRRKQITIDTPSQSVRSLIQAVPEPIRVKRTPSSALVYVCPTLLLDQSQLCSSEIGVRNIIRRNHDYQRSS